jgi:hypothetical protein
VDAETAEGPDGVWMFKTCPAHGATQARVDGDAAFYRATMNRPPVVPKPPVTLVIPVTHRCNLDCALCFVPKRDRDNLSLEEVKDLIRAYPGPVIGLSGGEPTLREDLPEIMRFVRQVGKRCELLTNAIKLADREYLDGLVEAGLEMVLLSFNGFSDETYTRINGRPLLDVKLQALRNCVAAGLDIAISPTIFRDLNEGDIPGLIDLCLEHAPAVRELRIRGACRVGKHGTLAPLATSELFGLVASALGRTTADFLGEFEPDKCFHSNIQFNMLGVFRLEAAGQKKRFVAWNWGTYGKCGCDNAVSDLYAKVRAKLPHTILPPAVLKAHYRLLEINTWGWPDAGNFDFQEIWSHGISHLYDNRVPVNFCEAVLDATSL